jgi:hypothetical protein
VGTATICHVTETALSLQGPAYFLHNENGRQIWIRDCYERLANLIMDLYKERLSANALTSRVGAVITGNPGIGKIFSFSTCFGCLLKGT